MTCRTWLVQNNYEDVAALIDQAMVNIEAKGSKQRRNWWDVLAGDEKGNPCVREGIEFPVLRAAQTRQGKAATENAIVRSHNEQPPNVRKTNRWPKRGKLPTRAKRLEKQTGRRVARRHAEAS